MEQKEWGLVTEGARISISLPKRQFLAGEPIPVCLSIENADTVPLRVVSRSPWIDYTLQVLGPKGHPLPPLATTKRKMETLAESSRAISELRPGEEIRGCLQLEEGYDTKPPGTYHLTASREIYRKGGQSGFATAASPAIKFEVIPH